MKTQIGEVKKLKEQVKKLEMIVYNLSVVDPGGGYKKSFVKKVHSALSEKSQLQFIDKKTFLEQTKSA